MTTETKEAPKTGKIRVEINGEWVEMEVSDPKMLSQMRNMHDKQQEATHSKARETFRKTVSKLINDVITPELDAALQGQAILYRLGSGDDADDDVRLEKTSMIKLRERASPKESK